MSAVIRTAQTVRRALYQGRPHPRFFSAVSYPTSNFSRFVRISEEVQDAIATKKPVVALESAIYTHGIPYPDNLELAANMEQVIYDNGAVPATICILDGIARIGLSPDQVTQMGEAANITTSSKASRRDLPYLTGLALADPENAYVGGTTIAGTMILAKLAGIKVFATGGLGGVHRGAECTMDISADLTELGRTNVAVISSGSKAFLDLEKTLEYLETQGVYVGTFGDRNAKDKVQLPAFYSRGSGIPSPSVVESAKEAAAIIHASHSMGLTSGQFFANPIPEEDEIPYEDIKDVIDAAVLDGDKNTKGKDITPYVLSSILKRTGGKSVIANRALVLNNARMGAEVAVELARFEKSEIGPIYSGTNLPRSSETKSTVKKMFGKADIVVVGGVAVDVSCDFLGNSSTKVPALHTSNPTKIVDTLGGVANNVAYAAQLAGAKVRLVSSIGSDVSGKWILEQLHKRSMDISGIATNKKYSTARYVAVNDSNGGLHLACADMAAIEFMSPGFVIEQIEQSGAKCVCVDGNLGPKVMSKIIGHCQENEVNVFFEPTSMAKATHIFPSRKSLEVFPNASIYAAAPNIYELDAMYDHAVNLNLFDTELPWWNVMESLGLDSRFRNSLDNTFAVSITDIDFLSSGILQKAIQLSPYIPNQFIKLGRDGVLVVRLLPIGDAAFNDKMTNCMIVKKAREGSGVGGIYIKHFSTDYVDEHEVVSVNGAGDTFLGALMAKFVKSGDMRKSVNWAQKAAARTLMSREAVSTEIAKIKY